MDRLESLDSSTLATSAKKMYTASLNPLVRPNFARDESGEFRVE